MRPLFSLMLVLASSLLAQGVPEGLSASEWTSIRAAYEAGRHATFAVDGGYQARNPGQHWSLRFDGRGFLIRPDTEGWTWGLELVSYGVGANVQAVTQPDSVQAEGQRVTYQWDHTLDEWYVNGTNGLEHGYTVHQRPPDEGPLLLSLHVRGELTPRVARDGRDVLFTRDGLATITYAGLQVIDADGRKVPARFEAVPQGLRLSIEDRGARYPLTVDPTAQQAYLKASNTGVSDEFGYSVAVSGDTVVVGAPAEDSNATGVNGNQTDNSAVDSGAAYVFVRSGVTWTQQAYLKASNAGANDVFGGSVAVSGDTIVVEAQGEDSNATGINGNQADNSAVDSGAAYVFVRSGVVWNQQAYLKASNTGGGDNFGFPVAVSGDTVVAGAVWEDSNATGINGNQADNSAYAAGAAYVFVRSGVMWSQQAYLKASNTGVLDLFGHSVAVSCDTVVVGAAEEDSNATGINGNQADNSASNSGAAYVFVRSGVTWSQQAYLKASNTGASDRFGYSVAVSGDTVVVGAYLEGSNATGVNGNQVDNSALAAGAAYVFDLGTQTVYALVQQAYVKASNTGADDYFGWSVAVSGDTVVVGALFEDSNATGVNGNQANNSAADSGAVYVFVRSGVVWTQQAYLKASNTNANDYFG